MEPSTRVVTFIPNLDYIKLKRGEAGEKAVMDELKRKGYNYDFRNMKRMEWVPLEVRREFLYAVRDELGWDEKRIFDMGLNSPRISFVIKHFFGLFLNMKRVFQHAPEMWREHYSSGEFIFTSFEDNRGSIIIKNMDVDPLFCEYMRGYFTGIVQLARVKNVKVEETKCTFRGDEYHQYVATWTD